MDIFYTGMIVIVRNDFHDGKPLGRQFMPIIP